MLAIVMLALGYVVFTSTRSAAVAGERVRFVNMTGEPLWIGSGVNADGSRPIGDLPSLDAGESDIVVIPDSEEPMHWRGRFFARQRCSGQSGSTFHCLVGDCGVYADRCEKVAEPVSLAEFNFDQKNRAAPWYNVSYVDAVSLTITIEAPGSTRPVVAGSCARWDCSGGQLLAACPRAYAVYDPQRGDRVNCVNPNRDAESDYTAAIRAYGPRAYAWSTHDRVPGNETMFNCPGCADFVVTFRSAGAARVAPTTNNQVQSYSVKKPRGSEPSTFTLRGFADKCVNVPGGVSADGAQLQLWDCNGQRAQDFSRGPNGSLVALGKCMDVAWASRDNGAKVQLAHCNGGPAQVWVVDGSALRNPHSNKCLDVRERNTANGAPLQIWECNPGQADQSWRLTGRPPVNPGPKPAPRKSTVRKVTGDSGPEVADEQRVVDLTNQERAAGGCGPLRVNARLAKAARLHSEDQAAHNHMSHISSDGSDPWQRARRSGYDNAIGENVAMGYRGPAAVLHGWMTSEGHRRNILNCAARSIGVGLAYASNGTPYWTQMFGSTD
ncbi:hypothetical protein GCM10022251_75550 [Phytohabitans flavus]|uniref:Ricin B lectin domain-containing protein n=1 Tax=Phytohabitans flavus TaxID=1076124 RepID=A0A6F8XME9_9ACTN|nr:hypothetical protein Pflav_014000 [Phytohabitans flavus]